VLQRSSDSVVDLNPQCHSRAGGNPVYVAGRHEARRIDTAPTDYWIPAFAAMTPSFIHECRYRYDGLTPTPSFRRKPESSTLTAQPARHRRMRAICQPSARAETVEHWIPALAGMTAVGVGGTAKELIPADSTSLILVPPHRRGVLTEHCGGGSGDGGAVPCRVGRVSASLSAVPASQKTERDGRDDSPNLYFCRSTGFGMNVPPAPHPAAKPNANLWVLGAAETKAFGCLSAW